MPDKSYKQIVVLSGKGGTGKTTISAAFTGLIKSKVIIDCDVDAANLHLLLKPERITSHDYYGGKKASIDKTRCDECGLCESVCSFDAINNFDVDPISCEGCGFCFRICPLNAISFNQVKTGSYYECLLEDGTKFYFAKLSPGEGNSGKLVTEIKKNALDNLPGDLKWVIVDGPPGIGCPVNASISSADIVVIVTEPTLSGIHDLKRLVELIGKFNLKSGIIINKYDLNQDVTSQIYSFSEECNIPVIGKIRFSKKFTNAIIEGKSIIETDENIRNEFINIWEQISMWGK
ncbi:MAG: ATP-binding protein [Melioribacteraceae bacterium]|nr:ATP-binding protein [Melioribacteraceae bacterium]